MPTAEWGVYLGAAGGVFSLSESAWAACGLARTCARVSNHLLS